MLENNPPINFMDVQTLPLHFDKVTTQRIEADWLSRNHVTLNVLRLDLLHPIVSGNKWFKLRYYLEEALQLGKTTVATFGGAYSNHILATAFACKAYGLQSVGFIRGEKPDDFSPTLKHATEYGMRLIFLTRDQYKQKETVADGFTQLNWYWITEGGYGSTGAKGASEIMKYTNATACSHILASVGTGTMLAGIALASQPEQQITGISSMKGNMALEESVHQLLPADYPLSSVNILHDYHFGGYAKYNNELLDFINNAYLQYELPLDIVYTGKLFFAVQDLVQKQYFKHGSNLLMIHSGGLQGNSSLPQNALTFL
jgi:1-aminocyclopropane-1-carboxylate deaminase